MCRPSRDGGIQDEQGPTVVFTSREHGYPAGVQKRVRCCNVGMGTIPGELGARKGVYLEVGGSLEVADTTGYRVFVKHFIVIAFFM